MPVRAADIEPLRDRQSPHRDQFSGLRADDGRAQDLTLRAGDDLYMTMRFALGLGAVIVMIGPAQDAELELARARLRLGQAGLSQFRIGIGHPRNAIVVHLDRQAEQRIPDHQAGVIIGGVGELQLPGRAVADRIDAPVAGFEPLVHRDAGAVIFDAGGFEVEPVDGRLAAGGDQQMNDLRRSPRRPRPQTSPPRCRSRARRA